ESEPCRERGDLSALSREELLEQQHEGLELLRLGLALGGCAGRKTGLAHSVVVREEVQKRIEALEIAWTARGCLEREGAGGVALSASRRAELLEPPLNLRLGDEE